MRITAISDLHGHLPSNLPGGDVLILAGDYACNNMMKSWGKFYDWLEKQDYEWKVYIAGNHDNFLTQCLSKAERDALDFSDDDFDIDDPKTVYLKDSSIEIDGIKIYGSPWTPIFTGINLIYSAFVVPEYELPEKFTFPDDLDVLITHGPPWGILDQCPTKGDYKNCGSRALLRAVQDAKPRYHLFGHIHEKGGAVFNNVPTTFMNVSHCDEFYRPREEIRSFEI